MTEITQKQQELIYEVMDNFDFGRVVKVMELLEWRYPLDPSFCYEESYLRQHVRKLIVRVMNDSGYCDSGGWRIIYHSDTEELSCEFILTCWDA